LTLGDHCTVGIEICDCQCRKAVVFDGWCENPERSRVCHVQRKEDHVLVTARVELLKALGDLAPWVFVSGSNRHRRTVEMQASSVDPE
jgi:hypothetical protein